MKGQPDECPKCDSGSPPEVVMGGRRDQPHLRRFFCPVCSHTWTVRTDDPPDRALGQPHRSPRLNVS